MRSYVYKCMIHTYLFVIILFLLQLEPGESKDIFMPIVSKLVQGEFDFTVKAQCFMERDTVTKHVRILVSSIKA